MLRFAWDSGKEASNRRKHGVSFQEAQTVFLDEGAIQFFDDEHSGSEDRFILLGLSSQLRLLVVCHCEITGGNIIRIISARKATRSEHKFYLGTKR
ncbi:MAG: BrnT family toxin [Gammaproteobacteria bacterium]|nr:BrnT family toxin [Gammaproteobacteria bacterium]